ncbi:MAG: hydrogenase maturation protease [Proteobacteria bacterium]|nr:hydrogenase maturation protease [Pseudomonadota bacterium]
MKKRNKLAIVGIGNELCKDDGFGIFALKKLEEIKFDLGTLIEGGTSGLSLIPLFFEYENIIFLDILRLDDLPGTIYTIPFDEAVFKRIIPVSFHDIGIEDAYIKAKFLGSKAKCYVVGIVPEDFTGIGEISETLKSRMDIYLDEVMKLSNKILSVNI